MNMDSCVYLCCGKWGVICCCKFGGIGMKMAICVYCCCDECTVSVLLQIWWDLYENGHL